MTLITSWSLQSPDTTPWQATISAAGVVTWNVIGAPITGTPPVYADTILTTIWTPSISNAGVITLTSGTDTGQLRAALLDPSGVQYIATVTNGIAYFKAPMVHVGDLLTFGLFNQESVPLLVKSIEPGPDLTARITFVDAAPGVHLASTGAIPAFESHITLPRVGQAPVPLPLIDSIASDETVMLRSTDGSLVPRIVISLHFASGAAQMATSLEVQHRLAGSQSNWDRQIVRATARVEVSILNVMEGLNYDVRVRALGPLGETSDWVTITPYAVTGKTSAPPDVTGLSLNHSQLVWLYPDAPPDLAGFRVRVHVGQRTSWGDAMPLHDGLVSATLFPLFRDSGQRTYLVVAVDTSDNESLVPATCFVDYGALATQNVAELIDLQALGFPGTLTGGSLLGGQLVANSDTVFWKADGLPFWTTNAALMWPGTYVEMAYTATVTPPLSWLGGTLLLELLVQANGWRVDYAQDSGSPWWGEALAVYWSNDSALFWSGVPSAFAPWPGQLTGYTHQAYQLRITTAGGNIQGTLSHADLIFDMPDLEEVLVNIPTTVNGSSVRLPLTKTFSAILVVAPTLVEGSGARRILVLDKDPTGPLVVAMDSADSPVDAFGDYIIKGY